MPSSYDTASIGQKAKFSMGRGDWSNGSMRDSLIEPLLQWKDCELRRTEGTVRGGIREEQKTENASTHGENHAAQRMNLVALEQSRARQKLPSGSPDTERW